MHFGAAGVVLYYNNPSECYNTFMAKEQDFIKEFTVFGTGIGLPKSVARILGFLIICTPQEQSSTQIQKRLNLSSGNTSMSLAMLIDMQLVERVRVVGERKHYYRLLPKGFVAAVLRRLQTFKFAENVADLGLSINPGDERLTTMKHLYAFLDKEMQGVTKKLNKLP